MTKGEVILAIITSLIGTGGIASLIIALFSIRKYKAEAKVLEQQVESEKNETQQKVNEYIRQQLKELSETHKQESDELRRQNKELNEKLCILNERINQLMTWVVTDNNIYRTWLENELKKRDPDIEFPRCRPAPGFEENKLFEVPKEETHANE